MARIIQTDVEEILQLPSGFDATAFITAANTLVTNLLTDSSVGYSDATLAELERWLAAHFCTAKRKQTVKVDIKGVSDTYSFKAGYDLRGSQYGQMAITLDTSGRLAKLADGKGGSLVASVQSLQVFDQDF